MDKYEEALQRAKAAYGTGAYDDATMAFIFPELAESDDERVVRIIKQRMCDSPKPISSEDRRFVESWLLEKQKEQKPAEYVFRPVVGTSIEEAAQQAIERFHNGDRLVLAFNGWYIKIDTLTTVEEVVKSYDIFCGKSKSIEWSEEDEDYISDVMWCIEQARKYAKNENDMGTTWCAERWIRSLRPQPHTVSIENAKKFGELEYERGVKDGLNHRWKPSEEQMETLSIVIDFLDAEGCKRNVFTLRDLYKQLKNL